MDASYFPNCERPPLKLFTTTPLFSTYRVQQIYNTSASGTLDFGIPYTFVVKSDKKSEIEDDGCRVVYK